MNPLLNVEIRRILARRLVRVILLAAAGGFLIRATFLWASGSSFQYTDLTDWLMGTGGFVIVIAWVIGASFMGAEWQKGTITTLLTWEPRRTLVIGTKVLACALVVGGISLLLQAFLALVLLPAGLDGTMEGTDSEWLREAVGIWLRTGAGAAIFGALAFGIAEVGRSTGAALGVGFVYFAIVEAFIRAWRPRWTPWLLGDNIVIFITGQPENATLELVGRSTFEAGVILLVYAGIAFGGAMVLFRHRDVT
jgi:ABC-type transport system involved in multi-copper enzyme maturation permease subunit